MIKGFRGTSLVDYPGKVASVIYTYTCNYRCPYCYNIELVLPEYYQELPELSEEEILKNLSERKGFIQGVVITGGEPTLWGKRLAGLIEIIKYNLELPIKLDTNGSNPELLKYLLEEKLIDFVAMDFKTSPEKYASIGGDFAKVERSLNYLRAYPQKTEIRITLYPPLVSEEDFELMLPYLEGFSFIALQKYLPEKNLSNIKVEPYSKELYETFYLKAYSKLKGASLLKRF
ncbi:MAG: anaerobic ribonucleoside-triphosphate reductase activating protein [Caldimicrobium sp.]